MNIISLSAYQLHVKKFRHPAFEGIKSPDKDTLEVLVGRRHEKGGEDALILALRSTARYLIGRYMWHWPITIRFLESMVSESLLAIVMLVRGLNSEMLEDSNIQKLASRRIRSRIEAMLNKMRSISAPSLKQQYLLKSPIYLISEREPDHEDKATEGSEQEKLEMLDALQHMREGCDIACTILSPENWGLTDEELAAKIGVTRTTVMRRRGALLTEYLKLIEGDDD